MHRIRVLTVALTAAAAVVIVVGPSFLLLVNEAQASGIRWDKTCLPGAISIVKRIGFLFNSELRPCLQKPQLPLAGASPTTSRQPAASSMSSRQPAPRKPMVPRHVTAQSLSHTSSSHLVDPSSPGQMPWVPLATTVTTPRSSSTPAQTASADAPTLCSPSVHDQYVTVGPDGQTYPTWHPLVDPLLGCVFGHEHGNDPSTSAANSDPPPFGYVVGQIGMTEAHAG
jgi:hypothetical protein